jgi:hypothetical protein
MTKNNTVPVVDVAKETAQKGSSDDSIVVLSDGNRAKLVPVSPTLVQEVVSRVQFPDPPMIYIESKDREEPNEFDPKYLKQVDEARTQQGLAGMDAMVMFGVELIDGLPEDEGWLKKLKYMQNRGQLDLSSYDLTDEIDLEFLYKRYIIFNNDIMEKVSELSGISNTEVEKAADSFQGS